jgi:hypothetical protein
MDKGFVQQLCVFAAVFLILQVGIDLLQGTPITPQVFLGRLIMTLIATGLYGALTLWFKKRKERED